MDPSSAAVLAVVVVVVVVVVDVVVGTRIPCIGMYHGPISFRGAEVLSCPNIFSVACPIIKWFCPKIT